MKKQALLLAGLLCATPFLRAQQTRPAIKVAPMPQTSPVSGREMYGAYCASCHGADARGNGPAASSLKLPPADLTMLSQKNGGKFPGSRVAEVLRSGATTSAHGTVEMPVWGDLLRALSPSSPQANMLVHERIFNLTDYLKSIQK